MNREERAIQIRDRHHGEGRYCPRRTCEAPGCRQATSNAKPYCFVHVHLNPQARAILAAEQRKERAT